MATDAVATPAIAATATSLLERTCAVGDYDAACIYWFDVAGNVLVPLALTENLRQHQHPVVHPGQGAAGRTFVNDESIYLERGYQGSRFALQHGKRWQADSIFTIPLRLGNARVGVLGGLATTPRRYDDPTRARLEAIAAEVVPAFGVVGGMLVEAQVTRAEYALVSSLIREYASDADFEATCLRISSVAMTLLGGDYAIITRREPDVTMSYHGGVGTNPEIWRDGAVPDSHQTIDAVDHLNAGDIVVVPIDPGPHAPPGFYYSQREGARTIMIVPILVSGHRIGDLLVGWRTPVQISKRLQHLAQTLAGHAAIVLAESQRPRLLAATEMDTRRRDDAAARSLVAAIAGDELTLVYQPIYHAVDGDVVMVEALCRWPTAPPGFERPDRFITFAEDRGIIGGLTEYVIDLAAREWSAIRHPGVALAVNVSMRNFEEREFAERVLARLARYGILPYQFGIELTETTQLHDRNRAVEAVRKLTAAGVRVSIDDFGEGYAALSYLRTFRASALKIDRRFVKHVAEDAYDHSIVRSVTELAHGIGVAVIAEGIETDEALETIRAIGCDMAQGYGLARPMPIDKLHRLLRD